MREEYERLLESVDNNQCVVLTERMKRRLTVLLRTYITNSCINQPV